MNLVQLAPTWLVAILCAVLIAAAVEDFLRLKVSNITVLLVIAAAGVAMALVGPSSAVWENLLIFAVLLLGGTFLFASGKVGGGDVKLLAALGLWIDLERAPALLAAVFISGGFLALAVLTPRLFLRRSSGIALRDRTKGVPYAVAITLGALMVIVFQRQPDPTRPSPLEFRPLPSVAAEQR